MDQEKPILEYRKPDIKVERIPTHDLIWAGFCVLLFCMGGGLILMAFAWMGGFSKDGLTLFLLGAFFVYLSTRWFLIAIQIIKDPAERRAKDRKSNHGR